LAAWLAGPALERTLHVTFLWRAKHDPGAGQHINAAMPNDANHAANLHHSTTTTLGNCPTTKGLTEVVQSPGNASHLVFDVRVNSDVPAFATAAAEEGIIVLARELRVFQNTHSTNARPVKILQCNMSATVALTDV
jgi:hypothetical protein